MKQRMKSRGVFVGFCILLGFFLLISRLWWVQIVDDDRLMKMGEAQWSSTTTLDQKRGTIYDRNGIALAYDGPAYKIEAQVKPNLNAKGEPDSDDYVQDPVMTAQKLSAVMNVPYEKLLNRLTGNPNAKWVELGPEAGKLTLDQKNKILDIQYPMNPDTGARAKKNQMPGIKISEVSNRFYPKGKYAAHVLGFLDYKNDAVMGIEKQYDPKLKGKPGRLETIKDGAGYQLPDGEVDFQPAVDGQNITLTIDHQIQSYVEQALDRVNADFKPKGMTVIVADPHTGEVLAMSNRPHHDPNDYRNIENYSNYAVSYTFEPGSTFKIITLAASIEEGVFARNKHFESGSFKRWKSGPAIYDHRREGWGPISYLNGVQRSSNVLFAILGYDKLGQEKMAHYFDAFGFGKKTNIQLPGEGVGNLRNVTNPNKFSPRDLAVTTIGQGVTVTPIQQVAAVSAIANGGKLMQPMIVKEITDPHSGKVLERIEPKEVGRPISEATAKETREILQTVVDGTYKEGATGRSFKLDHYSVAGKTGTAQKYNDKGKIVDGKYIYSFIGFAPVENPRLLVYVVVDDPAVNIPSYEVGSTIIAPIFKSVMQQSLQYLQETPDLNALRKEAEVVEQSEVKQITAPELINLTTEQAKSRAKEAGLELEVMGSGQKIVNQVPAAFEKVGPGTKLVVVTDGAKAFKMPDFKGKSMREVLEYSHLMGMAVNATGTGYVVEQNIEPGKALTGKESIQVKLSPQYQQ
ncbi:PASTA domain-containing penicillin-binding protein [Brevibacillus daliensis]|uniref:PASTA domain-containing penicillin-binding protein n=1 Tax=Brevibacillus daliensis TaxID=2892995 RepID=UPI001E2B1F07|nr:PASTA domain-containing penicillin-binding protein [Brevibacillus daliensis]